MDDFRSLKLLDSFKFLFKALHVDYGTMRKILELKLTMDQRRAPTVFTAQSAKKKEGNQFLKSLWIYTLYGLIIIPFLFMDSNYIFQMSLAFGIILFFLMTSMISEFTTVLLDVRDKNIIGTKPVSRRSLSAARMVHICIYMTLLTLAIVIIPLGVMIFKIGLAFSLLFIGMLLLSVLFVIALTALIYIFILRFFSGEQLKDIINYVQILLSVGVVIGYQVLIRSFEFVDFTTSFHFSWWHILIPPIWFGAPFEVFLAQNHSSGMITLTVLGIIMPIISILVYYRLMPSFERNLEKLLTESRDGKKSAFSLNRLLSRLVCFTKEEQVFFQFSALMMSKERDFKLKVYPSLGMALIFPFLFLFNMIRDGGLNDLSGSKIYLTIYFSSIIIPAVIHMLKYAGSYRGGWIFTAAPVKNISLLGRAAVKAFIVKLYLPVFTVLSVVFLAIFSTEILPDLVVVFLSGCIHTILSYILLNKNHIPFSESFEFAQEINTAENIMLTILAGVFAIVHLMVISISYGIYIYLAVLLFALITSWIVVFRK
ncbi:hypothetical protein ACFO3D_16670 [Virgibacillus kekensis]|uniref:ABC transporter permease n=1 Tax=Virgibacillus kekensis TaxID=202261 RepID=A0ABV9DLR6_9BACI